MSSSEVHGTTPTSNEAITPKEAMCKLEESSEKDSPVHAISNLKAVHSKLAMLFNNH